MIFCEMISGTFLEKKKARFLCKHSSSSCRHSRRRKNNFCTKGGFCFILNRQHTREMEKKVFLFLGERESCWADIHRNFSVTRWLDYLIIIWQLTTLKICQKALKICHNRIESYPNIKVTLGKTMAKDILIFTKVTNFAESRRTE